MDIPSDIKEAVRKIPKDQVRAQIELLWEGLSPLIRASAAAELEKAQRTLEGLAKDGPYSAAMQDGLRLAATLLMSRALSVKNMKTEGPPPSVFKALDDLYAGVTDFKN